MMKHNAANERIKRDYFRYLVDAKRQDDATIDGVAKSLARFEGSTKAHDFKLFRHEQAVAFKARMANAVNARTGEKLSKATLHATMRDLRAFFFWLAHQPGFKSRIQYTDADYFNLSNKDLAIAGAKREVRVPTLEQVLFVLSAMPAATVLERRDRALVAFTALTGARVAALASFQLRHVNIIEGYVDQDARDVRTKFAKTFRTYFKSIGGDALAIVNAWHDELTRDHLWSATDPLFPASQMGSGEAGTFAATGLTRSGWSTTSPIREIFQRAFATAGLAYFNPHSFRHMLVRYGMSLGLSPEAMKAWSQNLGHADVMTTFTSYGSVPTHRQGELIRSARSAATGAFDDPETMALLGSGSV